jgi:macrolide transport system ATP-binding/permease protein
MSVVDGVSLVVAPGTRWGVVGENGRGKPTLLQVMAGVLPPDRGRVRRTGRWGSPSRSCPSRAARPSLDLARARDRLVTG